MDRASHSVRMIALTGALVPWLATMPYTGNAQPVYRHLAGTPTVRLEGFSPGQPFGVIGGAAMLPNGGFVVADKSQMMIGFFDAKGKLVRSAGGIGGGPGEFRTMDWLGFCSRDTLWLFDPSQNRITRFDANGRLADTRPAAYTAGAAAGELSVSPYALACNRSGAMAAVSWPTKPPPAVLGPHRSQVSVTLVRTGRGVRSLGLFSGPERYRFERSDGPRPFGKGIHVVLTSSRALVGTADSFYVSSFDLDGRALGSFGLPRALKQFDKGAEDFQLATLLNRVIREDQKAAARRTLRETEFPERYPAYTRAIAGPDDSLWLEEALSERDTVRLWHGFAANGRLLGSISVPPQVEITEIGINHVIGRWRGPDGSESAGRWELEQRRQVK